MARKCVTGINDVATTDPERAIMFADPERATLVTRSSRSREWFRCLDDSRHPSWEAKVYHFVAAKSGCPFCAGRLVSGVNDVATTDPERSKMFADPEVARTVTRGSNSRELFRCPDNDDHPAWESTVSSVIIRERGCPACAGSVVSGLNDVATTDPGRVAMFVHPERATKVSRGSGLRETFRCLDNDRHPNWEARVVDALGRQKGCPVCAGHLRTGVNDVATTDPDRVAMFAHPERAVEVTRGSDSREEFRCLSEVTHPNWETSVYEVVSRRTGCPSCADRGFDPSKPGTLYVLDATTHIVFGITGNLEQRLKDYDDSRVLLHRFDYDDGGEARRIETAVKRQFKNCRYTESNLPGEVNESLVLGCLADLLEFLHRS